MKIFAKILLAIVALAIVFIFGSLGYIPGLSKILGADKPRDLGVRYSEQDRTSARAKSQVIYEALPDNTPPELSLQRSGSRPITTSWNSAEVTALMNNRPWRYWPIKDVQLKINNDGTAELSGVLIKDKLKGYAAGIGAPANVADTVAKFLPPNPTFYIKAKTSLTDNRVSDFDIQSVYLGKIPIPTNTLLSSIAPNMIESAFAQGNIVSELSKYQGKKAAIVDFINNRLSQITGFYARKAYFQNGQLYFDGTLSEIESTTR